MQPERDSIEETAAGPEDGVPQERDELAAPAENDPEWADLLGYLLNARGFDFHGYKPASLARRIRKRMSSVGLGSFAAYQDYLEVHPDEFATLFNVVLINVTGFFRDPAAWDAVRTIALPQILDGKAPDQPIRVWSAGCATGEEAYTIAMILAEELGPEQVHQRVKIYATDVDEEALNTARQAMYQERQLEGVPPELRSKYFEQLDGVYVFRKDLRRQVIFGRHDLINDAPISRIDLLTCRNTLMYLNAETQARVLARLHFALNNVGFLLLGRAETLMAHGHSFVSVDLKRRLSRRSPHPTLPERFVSREEAPQSAVADHNSGTWRTALDASPVAQLLVDRGGDVTLVNERARALFGIRPGEVGRPLRDLQVSYRPVELRSLIEKVEAERRPASVKDVEWRTPFGESRWLELHIAPLLDAKGAPSGALISFSDLTADHRLHRELEQSQQELETAYEELQSTNEELETTNEELQSTVEELETTNEELQSTNEELETMNEELQSTNEDLQGLNDELRQRGDEINAANAFLESVLSGLKGGVAVLDTELRVLAWNSSAEELWGLRKGEVSGHHLLNLEIGLPVDRLRPALRGCLGGDGNNKVVTLDAVNRRGKSIRCDITCTALRGPDDEIRGAILLMDETIDGKS
jgi:two-component system, chemotaxis family, CheB/CheR fusion protein